MPGYHWDYTEVPEGVMQRSRDNRCTSTEGSHLGLTKDHEMYDDTYDDDHKGPSTGHHIDALHAMHKKDKHPGVKFHTAQGDSDPHAVSISHDSPARKSKTFMAHVKKLASVPHVNEEKVEEDAIAEAMEMHLKPHSNGTHYTVHKVGKKLAAHGCIKVG